MTKFYDGDVVEQTIAASGLASRHKQHSNLQGMFYFLPENIQDTQGLKVVAAQACQMTSRSAMAKLPRFKGKTRLALFLSFPYSASGNVMKVSSGNDSFELKISSGDLARPIILDLSQDTDVTKIQFDIVSGSPKDFLIAGTLCLDLESHR